MIKKTESISSNVFVIYGRNTKLNESMFSFLESLGLHPLEWEEIVSQTGESSPYIGTALDKGFEMSQAAVVLLTPDDESRLRKKFQGKKEKNWETELTPQPRQNVLFEAGMAMGKFPDRTIIVEIGELRPFSDGVGRHTIRMNNSSEKRNALATRLENAGCVVSKKGDRWLTIGNFSSNEIEEVESKESEIKEVIIESETSSSDDNGDYKGVAGGIRLLIKQGFFVIPKLLKEIREELKDNGYFCSPQEVYGALKRNSGKNKPLKKLRYKKKWAYVIQK